MILSRYKADLNLLTIDRRKFNKKMTGAGILLIEKKSRNILGLMISAKTKSH